MPTAVPRGPVERKPLAKLRADEQKHHIRLSLEARWPSTSKPRDLMGRVNDAVVVAALAHPCASLH